MGIDSPKYDKKVDAYEDAISYFREGTKNRIENVIAKIKEENGIERTSDITDNFKCSLDEDAYFKIDKFAFKGRSSPRDRGDKKTPQKDNLGDQVLKQAVGLNEKIFRLDVTNGMDVFGGINNFNSSLEKILTRNLSITDVKLDLSDLDSFAYEDKDFIEQFKKTIKSIDEIRKTHKERLKGKVLKFHIKINLRNERIFQDLHGILESLSKDDESSIDLDIEQENDTDENLKKVISKHSNEPYDFFAIREIRRDTEKSREYILDEIKDVIIGKGITKLDLSYLHFNKEMHKAKKDDYKDYKKDFISLVDVLEAIINDNSRNFVRSIKLNLNSVSFNEGQVDEIISIIKNGPVFQTEQIILSKGSDDKYKKKLQDAFGDKVKVLSEDELKVEEEDKVKQKQQDFVNTLSQIRDKRIKDEGLEIVRSTTDDIEVKREDGTNIKKIENLWVFENVRFLFEKRLSQIEDKEERKEYVRRILYVFNLRSGLTQEDFKNKSEDEIRQIKRETRKIKREFYADLIRDAFVGLSVHKGVDTDAITPLILAQKFLNLNFSKVNYEQSYNNEIKKTTSDGVLSVNYLDKTIRLYNSDGTIAPQFLGQSSFDLGGQDGTSIIKTVGGRMPKEVLEVMIEDLKTIKAQETDPGKIADINIKILDLEDLIDTARASYLASNTDHHGENSKKGNCATKQFFELLLKMGVIKDLDLLSVEDPDEYSKLSEDVKNDFAYLKEFIAMVSREDDKYYDFSNYGNFKMDSNTFTDSYRTLYGYIGEVKQNELFKIINSKTLKKKFISAGKNIPLEFIPLSDLELKELGIISKTDEELIQEFNSPSLKFTQKNKTTGKDEDRTKEVGVKLPISSHWGRMHPDTRQWFVNKSPKIKKAIEIHELQKTFNDHKTASTSTIDGLGKVFIQNNFSFVGRSTNMMICNGYDVSVDYHNNGLNFKIELFGDFYPDFSGDKDFLKELADNDLKIFRGMIIKTNKDRAISKELLDKIISKLQSVSRVKFEKQIIADINSDIELLKNNLIANNSDKAFLSIIDNIKKQDIDISEILNLCVELKKLSSVTNNAEMNNFITNTKNKLKKVGVIEGNSFNGELFDSQTMDKIGYYRSALDGEDEVREISPCLVKDGKIILNAQVLVNMKEDVFESNCKEIEKIVTKKANQISLDIFDSRFDFRSNFNEACKSLGDMDNIDLDGYKSSISFTADFITMIRTL